MDPESIKLLCRTEFRLCVWLRRVRGSTGARGAWDRGADRSTLEDRRCGVGLTLRDRASTFRRCCLGAWSRLLSSIMGSFPCMAVCLHSGGITPTLASAFPKQSQTRFFLSCPCCECVPRGDRRGNAVAGDEAGADGVPVEGWWRHFHGPGQKSSWQDLW